MNERNKIAVVVDPYRFHRCEAEFVASPNPRTWKNAMTNSIHSVHVLVRLLKSSSDPPTIPGPSKIELAWLAWSDPFFRAANKGEVIGEWILNLFGHTKNTRREKDANPTMDLVADSRYWTLLCAVLTTPPPTAARPVKSWLLPLLNRSHLDAVVFELLTLQSSQVLGPARAALTVLWPLVEKKIGVDALAECLSVVFDACTEWERVDDNIGWICSAVVGAYRNAMTNAGNRKKLYNLFLATHLSSWLRAIRSCPSVPHTKRLQDDIYAAGTDTLFSLDGLKQPLDILFDALASSIPLLLPVLPKLYSSYLGATHRHKSALFVTVTVTISGNEEVKKRGMEFVERCWTLIRGYTGPQEDTEKWKSLVDILRVVERERLFSPRLIHGMHIDAALDGCGGELALDEMRDKAIEILEAVDASSKDDLAEQAVLSVQLLDVLVQIQYEFVGSILERVLSALINGASSRLVTTASSDFLTHVLEYHTKTRTVHTYALTLLGAVVVSSAHPKFLFRFSSSAFPLAYHLPPLSLAVRTSLTPTQNTYLATSVLRAVENAWRAFKDAAEEERSVKKRKAEVSDKSSREARLAPVQARAFSYTGRIAGIVLSNLPMNAYTEEGGFSLDPLLNDVGKLGWSIIWDILEEKSGKDREPETVKGRDGKKRKHAAEMGSLCAAPNVASAAFRFLYDVRARASFPLGDCDRLGDAQVETLLNVARDETSDSELVLEIIRTLLWHAWYTHNFESRKQIETQLIFNLVLDILGTHPLSKFEWSGVSAALTRENLGLAVLHVLAERWIDLLDALASTKNLERFVSLLLVASLHLPEDSRDNSDDFYPQRDHTVTLRSILLNLLQNSQFWELHNIRAVFLSSVLTLTTPLAPYCFPSPGFEPASRITTIAKSELVFACNIYRLLLYVPPEYLTRPVRSELISRAMAGDVQICKELRGPKGQRSKTGHVAEPHTLDLDDEDSVELEKWLHRLTSIRVFLQRMGYCQETTSHSKTSAIFVNHLLRPPLYIGSPPKALTNVTVDLIQLHIVNLLRSQEPEAAASACSVISTLASARPFSQPNPQETWTHIIIQSSVLNLIECVTNDFDRLSEQVRGALRTLLKALESALSPHAREFVGRNAQELSQSLSSEQINGWSRLLSLARLLGMSSQVAAASLGSMLATATIRSENPAGLDSEICTSVLGLLFEELWCIPDVSHHAHLDVLVCFCVINGGHRGSDFERAMDAHVSHASKRMSADDFSYFLNVLEEAIGGSGLGVVHRERLIHLGQVMLHDAPQGTLKVIQRFATRCFNLFVDREELYGRSSQLKLQCLKFIAKYCSDRPAVVRSVDLVSIWSFLNTVLSGSSEHDVTTMFAIFHHIVTIVGALIRLRRDLVVHTLPHLGLVLRLLMMMIRMIRPQLGSKQSKIVTDTFPSWLSASQPLYTDEARALARLLTSLTVKTVPRTFAHPQTSTETQKAESLAKPFAKHASYVLIAYVEAFNDPLCIISMDVRRELEPGLFALCEMVGEHSRDALMMSALDSGGKTIMKSIWKEYEKQRYVGKG